MQLLADREAKLAEGGGRPAGRPARGRRRLPTGGKPSQAAARSRRPQAGAQGRAQALLSVARPRPPHAPPTRADVLRFLEGEGRGSAADEILQALTRERGDRAAIKAILRELADEGVIGRRRRRAAAEAGRSARRRRPHAVLDVTGIDAEGDLLLSHPERPELRLVLPVENAGGHAARRRRPGAGPPRSPRARAATRRGRSGSCRASRARSSASSRRPRRAAHPLGRPQGAGRVRRGAARPRPGPSPAIWSWPRSIPTGAWAGPRQGQGAGRPARRARGPDA